MGGEGNVLYYTKGYVLLSLSRKSVRSGLELPVMCVVLIGFKASKPASVYRPTLAKVI